MTAIATVADLESRLGVPVGSLAGEDLTRASAVLADASEIVKAAGNPRWTDVNGSVPAPPLAVLVTVWVARRMWDNPEELSYEALGDHTVSRRVSGGVLTAFELDAVRQAAGFTRGAYSTGV